ncbi:hypothetical protein BD410DRAFT_793595 [Rickenella mellea]|uniref:Histone H1 n=1 Tax=Rickenella mellea TaxID=50990 RepID=A0A4Y7PSQ1_9AGAM|nr:hypothetical protein BD410DRAFT_793595 [Rickenella mellea]
MALMRRSWATDEDVTKAIVDGSTSTSTSLGTTSAPIAEPPSPPPQEFAPDPSPSPPPAPPETEVKLIPPSTLPIQPTAAKYPHTPYYPQPAFSSAIPFATSPHAPAHVQTGHTQTQPQAQAQVQQHDFVLSHSQYPYLQYAHGYQYGQYQPPPQPPQQQPQPQQQASPSAPPLFTSQPLTRGSKSTNTVSPPPPPPPTAAPNTHSPAHHSEHQSPSAPIPTPQPSSTSTHPTHPTHPNPGSDLPSYEEMIVSALTSLSSPDGTAPKTLFTWMAAHYPLQQNFRPSASQALQKAFRRGRLEKSNEGKYRLNASWEGGNTSRRTTRRPQAQSQMLGPLVSASPPAQTPTLFAHHPLQHPSQHRPQHQPQSQPQQSTTSSFASTNTTTPWAPYAFDAATGQVQEHHPATVQADDPGNAAPVKDASASDAVPQLREDAAGRGGGGDTAHTALAPESANEAWEAAQSILQALGVGFASGSGPGVGAGGTSDALMQNQAADAQVPMPMQVQGYAPGGVVFSSPLFPETPSPIRALPLGSDTTSPPRPHAAHYSHPHTPTAAHTALVTPSTSPGQHKGPSQSARASLQASLALLAAQLADLAGAEHKDGGIVPGPVPGALAGIVGVEGGGG